LIFIATKDLNKAVMQVDGATARATQFSVVANSKRSHLVLQMVTGLNGMGYKAKRLTPSETALGHQDSLEPESQYLILAQNLK
jgi:hypothetical protein